MSPRTADTSMPADDISTFGHQGQPPLINLFNDFSRLTALVQEAVERGDWLNAYLFAAGLNQIVEDYLHADPYSLTRVGAQLQRILPGPAGWIGSTAARRGASLIWQARDPHGARARISAWQVELAKLVMELAQLVATHDSRPSRSLPLPTLAKNVLCRIERFPERLKQSIVRLPSCFRSFDQQPEDLKELARAFGKEFPERARDLTVLGVRSSGSYLAPLLAAFLKVDGYGCVRLLTYRPGQRWLRSEDSELSSAARAGGIALVCDDPPISGRSLSRAGHDLEGLGFPSSSIVMLLQLFRQGAVPQPLQRWPVIRLSWNEWAIQQRLSPDAVQRVLSVLRPDVRVRQVAIAEPPDAEPRRHIHAVYRVRVDDSGGTSREESVYVTGAGLGYFGEHALAVARPLTKYLPTIFGMEAGLLYREYLLEADRIHVVPSDASALIGSIVDYVDARRVGLQVQEDFSLRLPDRGAVWQRVAEILGGGFGRSTNFTRPVLHRLGKTLVNAPEPAVIDGALQLRYWFQSRHVAGLRKIHFDQRAFSNRELYSYDPVFDLAGACAGQETAMLAESLRKAYEDRAGRIEPERWLLHQLVHLDETERRRESDPTFVHRAEALAMQRYAAEVWFGDLSPSGDGPVCALDVDGVLETTGLGFSAIGPTGALALRALVRHGYRPVIATGRSLAEVQERCVAYRLAGGVAEYGAAVHNQLTASDRELLATDQRQALQRVRTVLSAMPEVMVDPTFRLAVRAYRAVGSHRERLRVETIAAVLASEPLVEAVEGSYQTDFMARGVDKGTGLLSLMGELGISPTDGAPLLALAVGDTVADIPMFNLAVRAFAPAHAAPGLPARVRITRKPYQAGLSQAVASLIGHRPGHCPTCRAPTLTTGARLLMDALAAHDSGRLDRYRQILVMAWRQRRKPFRRGALLA